MNGTDQSNIQATHYDVLVQVKQEQALEVLHRAMQEPDTIAHSQLAAAEELLHLTYPGLVGFDFARFEDTKILAVQTLGDALYAQPCATSNKIPVSQNAAAIALRFFPQCEIWIEDDDDGGRHGFMC
jgi:hypothetical protein